MVYDPHLVMLSLRNVSAPKISGIVRADSSRGGPTSTFITWEVCPSWLLYLEGLKHTKSSLR
jgi:hypothetical protein